MNDLQSIYQQFLETAIDSASLQNEIKEITNRSFADPRSFYDEEGEYTLEYRGLTFKDDKELTSKFVMLDSMMSKDLMGEVDWKASEEDLRWNINKILKAKNYCLISEIDQYDEKGQTNELIDFINEKELKPSGYCLIQIDINSDSYVFTIIALSDEKKVRELADKI